MIEIINKTMIEITKVFRAGRAYLLITFLLETQKPLPQDQLIYKLTDLCSKWFL